MALIPRFDAHCDTLTRPQPLRHSRGHLDLERLSHFGPSAQVFALWAPPELANPVTYRLLLSWARLSFARNRDLVSLCRNTWDVRAANDAGKVAALLSVEGADLLGYSISGLMSAKADGVRMVNLVWNKANALCGAAMDGGSGLTRAGRRFVLAANELGVAIDLSHASEQSFWDVLALDTPNVLCSHSNSKALCNHPRNLTDEQIRALVERKSCIGLNLCPEFLGGEQDMSAILAQVDHFLALDAGDTLCLGADLDGIESLPGGITGVESMEKLYMALLDLGLQESLVRDIFWNNLLRFLEEVL